MFSTVGRRVPVVTTDKVRIGFASDFRHQVLLVEVSNPLSFKTYVLFQYIIKLAVWVMHLAMHLHRDEIVT